VLNNAGTKDDVELGWGEWECENVGLTDEVIAMFPDVLPVSFYGRREVACKYVGSGRKQEFREPPSPAASLEYGLASNDVEVPAQHAHKPIPGDCGAITRVQLNRPISVPLQPKRPAVVPRSNKAEDAVD